MRTLNAKQPYTECTFAFYKQRFQEVPDFKLKFNEVRRELT